MQKCKQQIKVNRQQVNINLYVRFSQSLSCRKIYYFFCDTYLSLHWPLKSQSNQQPCSLCCRSSCFFVVHLLRAVAVFFNIFLYIKRNQRFTAHISRLCYFLLLCLKALTFHSSQLIRKLLEKKKLCLHFLIMKHK